MIKSMEIEKSSKAILLYLVLFILPTGTSFQTRKYFKILKRDEKKHTVVETVSIIAQKFKVEKMNGMDIKL